MALWLVRAGKQGEHEQRFLEESRIFATWSGLKENLSLCESPEALRERLTAVFPDWGKKKVINYSGQLWPFAHQMAVGDWVVTPSKLKAAIHIGEITGPYTYDSTLPDPYFHHRDVQWFATDVPRSNFDQDLLYSFGAFMTICRLERNQAESRVRAMATNEWQSTLPAPETLATSADETSGDVDLERVGRDLIARLIIQRFKGHGLAGLVDAVLRAQGYHTYQSPEGPDRGIDILAAPGPLGFGRPRICVQVKSQSTPIGRETLDQLMGTMQTVQADQGLLVSWSGFKTSVDKEAPAQFFRVRLWDQDAIIGELLTHYERLDEELRADLPLKRVWTVATSEEAE